MSPDYLPTLITLGTHLRKRRLDLGLLQREAAGRMGVREENLYRWELNQDEPRLKFIPKIIAFLGYNPLPSGDTLAEQLRQARIARGLSQAQAAGIMGVHYMTVSDWERGEKRPNGEYVKRMERFIAGAFHNRQGGVR